MRSGIVDSRSRSGDSAGSASMAASSSPYVSGELESVKCPLTPRRATQRAPGSTASQQSAGRFIELGFQKELRERWVSLVSATVVQAYLCIAGQFQFARLAAVIDKRHRPHLGIGVRHDTNRPTRLDVAVGAVAYLIVFLVFFHHGGGGGAFHY